MNVRARVTYVYNNTVIYIQYMYTVPTVIYTIYIIYIQYSAHLYTVPQFIYSAHRG